LFLSFKEAHRKDREAKFNAFQMQRGQKSLLPNKREIQMAHITVNIQKEKADEKKMKQGEAKEDLVSFVFYF
jgi:hypothetical protein